MVVFVLGETARRVNFSLNGYARNTNPLLSKLDITNFSNVTSCGTVTEESLPCMFSHLTLAKGRSHEARHYENLLDVLKHAGLSVLWRDNNTGCKGLCSRVDWENMRNLTIAGLCHDGECHDEVLLDKIQAYIDAKKGDVFIVLHQFGSHGPAYYKRYPKRFAQFTPECTDNRVSRCSRDKIVNAYDNTILYTDYFLSKVINLLEKNSDQYLTAMLYLSDHGESLGEKGLYLHGIPFAFAPVEQTQVPMLFWLSKNFSASYGIDQACLMAHRGTAYTHSNLFHSVLGLLAISTPEYKKEFDIFAGCMKP